MSDYSSTQLVFVGGAPRSGTTLVQRLIGAHSQVYAGPEFDFVPQLAALRDRMVASVDSGRISAITSREIVDEASRGFLRTIFEAKTAAAGVRVFSEKTPPNLLYFPTLLEIFPDARFVMVVRHPFAIAASMKEVARKQRKLGKRPAEYCRDVQASAKEIERYWQAGFAAAATDPARVRIVHYEDVVNASEEIAAELCHFLGVPDEPGMVRIEDAEFEATETGISGWYSADQLKAPIRKPESGAPGHGLSPLERAVVSRILTRHPTLERYALEEKWPVGSAAFSLWLRATRRLRRIGRGVRRTLTV